MVKKPQKKLTPKQQRRIALETQLNKQYPGRVFSGDAAIKSMEYHRIPTASMEVDFATYGGFGSGKVVELYGPEDSGKTYFILETIGNIMKVNPDFTVLWIETEGDLDLKQVVPMFGIDIDRFDMHILDPSLGGEQALDIVRAFVVPPERDEDDKSGVVVHEEVNTVDMIVINTLAGLVAKEEFEKDMIEETMALQARMMSKFFRKTIGHIFRSRTCVIFINQERDTMDRYKPSTTGGGRALGYYATQRLRFSRYKIKKSEDKMDETKVGKYHVTVHKNRMANGMYPYRDCIYYAEYGIGVSLAAELAMIAKRENIGVEASGAWYYYPSKGNEIKDAEGNLMKWNGAKAFREYLEEHNEFAMQLRSEALKLFEEGKLEAKTLSAEEVEELQEADAEANAMMAQIEAELIEEEKKEGTFVE